MNNSISTKQIEKACALAKLVDLKQNDAVVSTVQRVARWLKQHEKWDGSHTDAVKLLKAAGFEVRVTGTAVADRA